MIHRRHFSLITSVIISIALLVVIPTCISLDNNLRLSSAENEEMKKPARWWHNIGPTAMPTRRKRSPSQYPTSTPTKPKTSPTASLPSYPTVTPSNDDNCYDCPPSTLPDDDCVSPQKSRPPMIQKKPPKNPPSKDNPKPQPEYSDDDNQSIDDDVDHNYNDGTGSTSKKHPKKGKPKASIVGNDPLSLLHL